MDSGEYPETYPCEGLPVASFIPPDFTFSNAVGEALITVTADGRIVLHAGVTWDEAARGFVQALRGLGCTVSCPELENASP